MTLVLLKETAAAENRVAATPDTVKKIIALGETVTVQSGAGVAAGFTDAAYTAAGATVTASPDVASADIVLHVQPPVTPPAYKSGALVIGMLNPYDNAEALKSYAAQNISTIALELVPRISRAQSMDVLSSQANLAGYRAVIEAGYVFGRGFPMMMTAAGTIPPAKVLILGVGVAGLQAIATAKRLGGVVTAFDVRKATKEQVESLGATFLDIDSGESLEGAGGYAKEASAEALAKQQAKIKETLAKTDIVITTAAIPGKPSPRLITDDMLTALKPGSVVVDLAAERGGNCAATKPGEVIKTDSGVTVVGYTNWASRIPQDASALYAKNILTLLTTFWDKESKKFVIKLDDDILKGCVLTHAGSIVHPQFNAA
ncbi:MAG: Re/Si-specific NAD(P)(+) transhydrogenase subunit alpha [Thalassospira sp.]|nr:Re/Si-specific NAD(P)(+) transhydrogenase subunit alpha [Thalassospira sp.]